MKVSRVHQVCPYLRGLKPCHKCPSWVLDPKYGKVKEGCRALAEEVVRIAQTGSPFKKVRKRSMDGNAQADACLDIKD